MNTLVIVLISAVCLLCGYMVYGRWLAKTWGIDPKAKTPAYTHEDGQDYVPTNGWIVFSHQFSSIAGAGPVTGPSRRLHSAGFRFFSDPCRWCLLRSGHRLRRSLRKRKERR